VIVWNGGKGATIGFATDDEFCRRVTEETGIPRDDLDGGAAGRS
jgi:hypothetical protein